MSIHFLHNKVIKALETESIYSSVFDVTVDGKIEHVRIYDRCLLTSEAIGNYRAGLSKSK